MHTTVYRTHDRATAREVVGLLKAAGIEPIFVGDPDRYPPLRGIPHYYKADIAVPDEQIHAAVRTLTQWEATRPKALSENARSLGRWFWGVVGAYVTVCALVAFGLPRYAHVPCVGLPAAGLAVALVVNLTSAFRRDARRNRIFLGLCVRCGYNLRGNVSGRCPECGKRIRRRRRSRISPPPWDTG